MGAHNKNITDTAISAVYYIIYTISFYFYCNIRNIYYYVYTKKSKYNIHKI